MTKGERIKRRRQELGLSQTDLADKVGITKQQMYKYENDIITNIPSDKTELIADALNTSPAYLMGWEESRFTVHGTGGRNSKPLSPSALTPISKKELRFALWGGAEEMDEEDLNDVLAYAEFVRQKKQKK